MNELITSATQATPEWLTAQLQQTDVLPNGHVTAIEVTSNAAFNSEIVHLRPTYSQDAPETAPRALLLKLKSKHWGKAEVAFYRLIQNEELPIFVRYYVVDYDADSGASICLLDDLSDTHGPPITRKQFLSGDGVPSDQHLNQIINTLARFHAHWWKHPITHGSEQFQLPPWLRSKESFNDYAERRVDEFDRFIQAENEDFPSDLTALFEHALDRLPQLWDNHLLKRLEGFANLTMCHGDCYFSQFLCPSDTETQSSYLIDFDSVHPNVGPHDLVYLLPTFWTQEQRQESRREERLLKQYHQTLQAHGVDDYTWYNLVNDYRLNLIFMIFDPIWNQTDGSPKAYWWPKLQCLVSAYQDWDSAELFG